MLRSKMNKRGQFESTIYAIIIIFCIGIMLFFFNHVFNSMYDKFDDYFDESTKYNNSEAHQTINRIQTVENSYWDYAFLVIFVGFMIQMMILGYATRTSIVFFWLYVIVGGVGLIMGTMLSNVWQEFAEDPTFTDTLLRFPITNMLLGTYYPTVITAMILLVIIVTFGKPGGSQ